jgi:hypothetical protein
MRNIAESAASFFLAASLLGASAATTVQVRLSPGPRLVGTRAPSSGSGAITAILDGNTLTLKGSFQGLLATPTTAQLRIGSLPGVRGPAIATLTLSPAAVSTSGAIDGEVKLTPEQLAAFRKGGLYVEIDSDSAPEGDLWGWILPR